MKDSIQRLLDVQDKDLRIHKLTQIIASVPEEKERIEQELSGTSDLEEQAKQAMLSVESKLKGIELAITAAQNKKRDYQSKSVEVKKNDEYKALLAQIDACDEAIAAQEDLQLAAWDELEQAKEKRKEAEQALAAANTRIKAALQDLDKRQENCASQIEKIRAERQELAAAVEPSLMQRYDRLLRRQSAEHTIFRKPVVALQGENCGGCFLKATTQTINQAKKDRLIPCEQCGALLYYAPGA